MTFRDIQDVWSFTTRNEHIQGPWPDSGVRGFPGPPCRGCHTAPTPATLPLVNVQPGLGLSGSNQAHRETWQDPGVLRSRSRLPASPSRGLAPGTLRRSRFCGFQRGKGAQWFWQVHTSKAQGGDESPIRNPMPRTHRPPSPLSDTQQCGPSSSRREGPL